MLRVLDPVRVAAEIPASDGIIIRCLSQTRVERYPPDSQIIRGNSGSGKSSIAKAVRMKHGRGSALVEQDYFRRIVLRELDKPGGLAPEFIDHTVRYLLGHGQHVVLEGIFWSQRYGHMIKDLLRCHRGFSSVFYLDISFEETLRRHQTRPQATEFTPEDMRPWYNPHDVLGVNGEHIIGEDSSFDASVQFIATHSGLCRAESDVASSQPIAAH